MTEKETTYLLGKKNRRKTTVFIRLKKRVREKEKKKKRNNICMARLGSDTEGPQKT